MLKTKIQFYFNNSRKKKRVNDEKKARDALYK